MPLLHLRVHGLQLACIEPVALEEGQHLLALRATVRPVRLERGEGAALTAAWSSASSSAAEIIRFIMPACMPPDPCAHARAPTSAAPPITAPIKTTVVTR